MTMMHNLCRFLIPVVSTSMNSFTVENFQFYRAPLPWGDVDNAANGLKL